MFVTFDDKVTPIWTIPFPAVTICPEVMAKTEIFNVSYVYKSLIENEPPHYNLSEDT